MICRKCGKDIPEDSAYCNLCGAKQETEKTVHRRGNGEGSASRRGRSWEARIVVGWKTSPDESHLIPVWKTKGGFRTKREALEHIPCLRQEAGVDGKKVPTLEEYYLIYSKGEMASLSVSKQVAYKGAWKKLESLKHKKINSIGIAELRDTVSRNCPSYYTARDCKVLLNHLYELAGADGWVSKDVPSYIVLPKLEEKTREVFSDTEQAALWKLYESGDMDAAIPLTMICTGMMPGEMQGLKVEHINLEDRKIVGVGMKTKVRKESPVFLPADIIPVMADLIEHAQKSGYIFKRNESAWYAAYYGALERAGCRRLEPYCCRHSTATRLAITEGIAPQTIQRMMRWSSTKMLDRYAHPDDSDVLDAADKIKKVE